MLRQMRKYFFGRRRRIAYVPRQYVNSDDDIRRAGRDEILLIRGGYARTPNEARRLLAGVRAVEYMRANPRKRRITSLYERLGYWLMRLQGAQTTRLKTPRTPSYLATRYTYEQ